MKTAIVGVNWGDEGKGRMVDLLAASYDIVVRYQGGNNAGHTVINQYGKFALNLLPSGIFRPSVLSILGNGVAIDIKHLCEEIERLRAQGVQISPRNLLISERAIVCFPFHVDQDIYEEERLAGAKYGSTRRGIGPVYGDKYLKKGLQVGELLESDAYLSARLETMLTWKNLCLERMYGGKAYSVTDILAWLRRWGDPLRPHIADCGQILQDACRDERNILFEAQLGALRDIDFGIYPFTSSSSVLAAYAPIGAGVPGEKIDRTIGVVKAYSTCVGEGPFLVEMQGEEADKLREAGGEYGAATGRPRRVGPLDIVATRYGVQLQGAQEIALTKLDVLSYMEKIPVCTAYRLTTSAPNTGMATNKEVETFPFTPLLAGAEPVYTYLPGWRTDISAIRTFEELPLEARQYIMYVEKALACPVTYVSVGPGREEIIERKAASI